MDIVNYRCEMKEMKGLVTFIDTYTVCSWFFIYFYNLRPVQFVANWLLIEFFWNKFSCKINGKIWKKSWLKWTSCICVTNGINHLISLNDRSYWIAHISFQIQFMNRFYSKKKKKISCLWFHSIAFRFACFEEKTQKRT